MLNNQYIAITVATLALFSQGCPQDKLVEDGTPPDGLGIFVDFDNDGKFDPSWELRIFDALMADESASGGLPAGEFNTAVAKGNYTPPVSTGTTPFVSIVIPKTPDGSALVFNNPAGNLKISAS